MENLFRKINLPLFTIIILFIIASCKKDDPENTGVRAGNWTGTDISFTVASNPLKIEDLEFNYSGHATGTICSFDYESSASFEHVTGIDGKDFSTDLNTFDISGTFTSDTIAEISITWTITDSNCDAHYTGNKIYTASYEKTK